MLKQNKWLALLILCLGDLMIVLDTTIVNVALPSIRASLNFTETGLVWVINAYMLTFGGFLLLGGRLGDLFGHRKLFLTGIVLFTLASLGCGLSGSQELLVATRALQGIGGAIVSAVALSLIITLFDDETERAKAMGVFGFVAAGGGAVGVFLGGLITNLLSWNWIFLVNIPVGIFVVALTLFYLPKDRLKGHHVSLDILGSILVTSSIMVLVYAIVNGNIVGWMTAQTLGLTGLSAVLMAAFLFVESKAKSPLVPLRLFSIRNVAVANLVAMMWAAAMFAWFFISALYLQFILHYSPFQVGMAFLPANIIMSLCSIGISAKLVLKYGSTRVLAFGLFCASLGLFLFSLAPVNGQFLLHILPSMLLIGFGGGVAFNPLLLMAMKDVSQEDAGVASGIVNTAFMFGGSVGLALLASISAYVTSKHQHFGLPVLDALNNGYHMAFLWGAFFAALAAGFSLFLFSTKK